MCEIRQAWICCAYNFRQWRRNPRVIVTLALAFILCFLLTEKTMDFARKHGTDMQFLEPFVWTFGDSTNILLASLLLVLLFADMPFIRAGTPLFLMRTTRRAWLWGQILYICLATAVYLLFVLLATCLLCAAGSFAGNQWSETAALLAYSGVGSRNGLPAVVKTLEMSRPYQCTAITFGLMLLYMLVLGSLMLAANLWKGRTASMVSAFVFSLYGLLLEPDLFMRILHLSEQQTFWANVLAGWCSPLNQATFQMHDFGYDFLPRLWQSVLFFLVLTTILCALSRAAMNRYAFQFTGTET